MRLCGVPEDQAARGTLGKWTPSGTRAVSAGRATALGTSAEYLRNRGWLERETTHNLSCVPCALPSSVMKVSGGATFWEVQNAFWEIQHSAKVVLILGYKKLFVGDTKNYFWDTKSFFGKQKFFG